MERGLLSRQLPEAKRGFLAAQLADLSEDAKRFSGFFANLRSDLTRREYSHTIKEFLLLYDGEIKHPKDIKKHHVAFYREYLETRYAPNTINKKISALSSFCKYLACPTVGLMDHNPCYGVKRASSERLRETAALTKEQVQAVFDALNPKRSSFLMHRAFLAVGFYTGLRIREILNLTIDNIGVEKGVKLLRFAGKRRLVRKIVLHPLLADYLGQHLDNLRSKGIDVTAPTCYLFPNGDYPRKDGPMCQVYADSIFRKTLDKTGFVDPNDSRRYSCHSMRATFATRLAELDVPLEEIQKQLGHADPATTLLYIKKDFSPANSPVFKLDF